MPTPRGMTGELAKPPVTQTEIYERVIGVESAQRPLSVVRVALEGHDDTLLLQLSEEAATQLLAHLLEVLRKRGLR